jgi:hypothetical protein
MTTTSQQRIKKLISFIFLAIMLSVSITPAFAQGSIYMVNPNDCATPPQGLVGWWPGNGNAEDIKNAHDGMAQNITYPPEYLDIPRQAFGFNGVNSSIKVPGHSGLDVGAGEGFTIETWVKPGSLTAPMSLVEWNNPQAQGFPFGLHLWLNVYHPGSIYANLYNGGHHIISTGPDVVQLNSYQHIVLTYKRSDGMVRIFYNGVEATAPINVGQITPRTNPSYDLYLGHRPAPFQETYFQGRMDEVSIYNRALDVSEIIAINNARGVGKCRFTILGETVDPCGDPMSDVAVLLGTPHSLSRRRSTDATGFFSFEAAANGTFSVKALGDTSPGEGFDPTIYYINSLNTDTRASFRYQTINPPECR